MKCEIIRDLLPSYMDGLTSEASNAEITEHLKTCETCKQYYNNMKQDVSTAAEEQKARNKKDVQAFRMLRRRVALIISLVVFAIAIILACFNVYWAYEWSPKEAEVKMTSEMDEDGVMTIKFESTKKNIVLYAYAGESTDEITVMAAHQNPFAKVPRVNGYYGYTFVDEDTVYTPYGGERDLTDADQLTVHFGDKTEEYTILDFYQK